ncbi:MAG: hypothetical protein K0R05_4740 [Anaerocolumna sp.]|nr:hypothetical protein [Anaerocolumna sp.]
MKKGIYIISGFILLIFLIFIGINIVMKYNAEKDGVCAFIGEDENWFATYTSIKVNGVNYDSFYMKYKGTNAEKYDKDEFAYALEGENFLLSGPIEFKDSYDRHLVLKEENKGDGIMDARECLELELSIYSPKGWSNLTLKRVDVRYFTAKPYDVIDENK